MLILSPSEVVTGVTRRVLLVEQEMLILPVHQSSPTLKGGFVLLNFNFLCSILAEIV
jgi:hypothetical protein